MMIMMVFYIFCTSQFSEFTTVKSPWLQCFSTIFKQMVDPDPSPKLAMARRLHWNMEKKHPELWKKVEGGDVAICRNPCRKQGSNGSGSFFCFGQCRQLAQPKDNKQYRVERLREEHTFGCFSFVQPWGNKQRKLHRWHFAPAGPKCGQ